ncbi:unnamed protein product [marine sediment metagenome]|uniref:Uncharacterized protein n=1 Tax=marine sediment metagenome TaxID=412755 RepID=X0TED0_9ZZZZ
MHTFQGTQGTVFNYNSDMSGDVVIIGGSDVSKKFELPVFDILEFAAKFIRNQQIAKLEQMGVHELLGL